MIDAALLCVAFLLRTNAAVLSEGGKTRHDRTRRENCVLNTAVGSCFNSTLACLSVCLLPCLYGTRILIDFHLWREVHSVSLGLSEPIDGTIQVITTMACKTARQTVGEAAMMKLNESCDGQNNQH